MVDGSASFVELCDNHLDRQTVIDAMPNTDLSQLDQRVTELRARLAPSTELIDALNALAQALSPIDVHRALEISKEANTLSFLLRHHMGMAVSLARLSWLHLEEGAFDTAVVEAHQAHFIAEKLEDYVLVARSLFVLATAQQMTGNFVKAEAQWRRLFNLAQDHCDLERQADYLNSLGILFYEHQAYENALDHFQRAHDIFIKLSDVNHVLAKNNLASALMKLGRDPEALELVEQALQLCNPEWQVWRALFMHTLGVVHTHLCQYESARRELDESLTINLSPAGCKITAADALIDIARLELLHSCVPAAYDALERAIKLAAEVKSVPQQIEAHQMLFRMYLTAHEPEGADRHHEAYLALQSQIAMKRIDLRMGLIRAEVEAKRQRPVWLRESQQLTRGPFNPPAHF